MELVFESEARGVRLIRRTANAQRLDQNFQINEVIDDSQRHLQGAPSSNQPVRPRLLVRFKWMCGIHIGTDPCARDGVADAAF
jgi:hypothetical protein